MIHSHIMRTSPLVVAALVLTALGCRPPAEDATTSNQPTTAAAFATSTPKTQPKPVNNAVVAPSTSDESEEAVAKDATEKFAQRGRGRGRMGQGRGPGRGGPGRGGPGRGMAGGNREDMVTLHALFDGRAKITRKIKNLPNGAETLTEARDAAIASLIQEHVPAMEGRVEENKPLPPMTFHPLFVEFIKHSKKVRLKYDATDHGLKVTYTSDDPYVVMLIQEHARLVSRFIKNGMQEIHKPYTIPKMDRKKARVDAKTPSSPGDSAVEGQTAAAVPHD